MKAPISFVYENCVFADGLHDAWVGFAVATHPYEWLPVEAKRARMGQWVAALAAIEADVQLLRVGCQWDSEGYLREMAPRADDPHPRAARRYACEHARAIRDVGNACARVFVFVSLREPQRDVASYISEAAQRSPRTWAPALRRALSGGGRTLLSAGEVERLGARSEQVRTRLSAFLQLRPASTIELQWLVRRAFCRGLGEPQIDRLHEPRSLLLERQGKIGLAPLGGQLVRWMDGCVEDRTRSLRVACEHGESWQAQLVLGALPERAHFPGPRAELMFAPVESLPFPVDLSLNARCVPNELALRMVRRRIQDADQLARAEGDSDRGVSDVAYERTQQARDLLAQLSVESAPPLLRFTLAVAIGAPSERELAERVECARRAYGEVRLHRPMGEQLRLFTQHLPAQRTRVRGYDDMLTLEQLAAMMPSATHAVGSHRGFYLGHTLSGSRQPVRFNLREGSERDRNTAILAVGALGSGKTTLAQKLLYETFLQGARVIDCDPKGDHRFHLLDEVAPHSTTIALTPQPALRGMLDPLRIAPEQLRREAAVSFLCDLFPARCDPTWETSVLAAVDRVLQRSAQPTCLDD